MNFNGYHLQEPVKFFFKIIGMALVGVLLGGAVEKVVTLIPRNNHQNVKCGGLLVLQLTIISFLIVFITILTKKNLFAWLSTDWDGRLFLLTFFVAQGSISQNIQCLFDIEYS
jgi:hypothetical protein